ncbi:ORF6N domain-containing protein [bacterium]|nr:ORF6N domain-containing protein [bacterium]
MENEIVSQELSIEKKIESEILVIRGQQVMIDRDLAELYGVETKRLNEQVCRNIERFPEEFCFQLNKDEFENWRSQFATSNSDKMGLRRPPYAFTEQGVAMLSAVLKSEQAILVSIQIMKVFVFMIISAHR